MVSYLLLSGLCAVLQTRIFKQLLIYSFLYETFASPVFQFVLVGIILVIYRGLYVPLHSFSHRDGTTATTTTTCSGSCERDEWELTGRLKAYFLMSVLISVSDAASVLPQIVLPSMLIVLISQFGLVVMMVTSYFLLGKRYGWVHYLAVCVVCLGMMVEIVPDYNAEISLSNSNNNTTVATDPVGTIFGEEYFHDRYAKRCVANYNATVWDKQKDDTDHRYHVDIMKGAVNASDISFSPFWWRGSGWAFAGCIVMLISSLVPACWSYAILEKIHTGTSRTEVVGGRSTTTNTFETVFWVIVCRCIISIFILPLFIVFSTNGGTGGGGGDAYFYRGWQCVFESIFLRNETTTTTTTTVASITTSNVTAPPLYSYWECSFWKRGVDCGDMFLLSSVYLVLDLLQYYLHIELIGKMGANTAWFYGMLKTGISDVGFSIPSLAGSTYSSTKYYDMLSFLTVACGVALFSVASGRSPSQTHDFVQVHKDDSTVISLQDILGRRASRGSRSSSSSSSSSSFAGEEEGQDDTTDDKDHVD